MGVSLERVQFKFASIIGELCSDPDTLSQFAVWLDLRLAEYKLKGAISLDCSGEEPNPLWLKGINKQNKSNQQVSSSHRSASSHSPSRSPFHRPQSASNTDIPDRLSPDVLVVKDEPQDVYPVQMHTHRNMDSSFTGRRKRSAAETISSESWSQDIQPSPSPKHSRMSSAVDSPSNQSLMSVIGGFEDGIQESESQGDNSALTGANVPCSNAPVPVAMFDSSSEYTDTVPGYNVSQTFQDSNLHYSSRLGNESLGSSNDMPRRETLAKAHAVEEMLGPRPVYRSGGMMETNEQRAENNVFRKSCINDSSNFSQARLSNLVYAVSGFERWLWAKPYNDKRWIFQIPPHALNKYLSEYFFTLKTPSGGEYKIESFRSLRSNIERYLKECDYPESITKSVLFLQCQEAYNTKVAQLTKFTLNTNNTDLHVQLNYPPCPPKK